MLPLATAKIAIAGVVGDLERSADHRAATASTCLAHGITNVENVQADEALESAQAFALDQFIAELAEAEGSRRSRRRATRPGTPGARTPRHAASWMPRSRTRSTAAQTIRTSEGLSADARAPMKRGEHIEDRARCRDRSSSAARRPRRSQRRRASSRSGRRPPAPAPPSGAAECSSPACRKHSEPSDSPRSGCLERDIDIGLQAATAHSLDHA